MLGINGAGKTTALECIEGLKKYDSGKITVKGKMGIQLQSSSLPSHIKPMEAIKLFAKWNKSRIDFSMLDTLGIKEIEQKQYIQLSTGQKRRLHLALALISNPDIIFLDEPTAGLDPKERVRFRTLISDFAQEKIVILSTHIVSDVSYIADTILMMKGGRFLLQQPMATVTDGIRGKVWEVLADDRQAAEYSGRFSVVNLHHENNMVRLRIISESAPAANAVAVEPSLEDLFLYHFGEEVQEGK